MYVLQKDSFGTQSYDYISVFRFFLLGFWSIKTVYGNYEWCFTVFFNTVVTFLGELTLFT